MEKESLKLEEPEKKEINSEEQKNKDTEKTKNNKKSEELKKSKKGIIIISIIGIIIFIAIVFSTIFAIININNNNIVSGVKIEGISVSGLSREEVKSKIELVYNDKLQKEILLKREEYDTTIKPELLETSYNIDDAIEQAINVGKDSNIFINNYNILMALIGKKNIDVNVTINEDATKKVIEDISTNIPGAMIEPSYYIENDKMIITKGKSGIQIDTENLINKIKENLEDINSNQEYIDIPVINKEPQEIDIEKIHEEVYKEVKDAYYTKDPFTIYPEVEGVDFNIEEAKALLQEDKDEYEIPLIITKPKITTAEIGSEAFPDLLGIFKTRYDASNVDRTTNLRIACQKINDKVLLPGETFSYNKTLGERTIAAGYRNAGMYENGQIVDGIGGGICQISSTLYNAVLMSNLEIVERRNHQFVTSYLPAGRDATVVYGMTDFKFKNTRQYAIRIKASAVNGVATISIYGIKQQNEYTITFNTRTISTIPYTIKYQEDSTLAPGVEKVKQNGANGLITETYIIKSLNGKVVSTTLLSRDTYSAMQKIILKRSIGGSENTNNQSSSSSSNQNAGNSNNGNMNTGSQSSGGTEKNPNSGSQQSGGNSSNNPQNDNNKQQNSGTTQSGSEE